MGYYLNPREFQFFENFLVPSAEFFFIGENRLFAHSFMTCFLRERTVEIFCANFTGHDEEKELFVSLSLGWRQEISQDCIFPCGGVLNSLAKKQYEQFLPSYNNLGGKLP